MRDKANERELAHVSLLMLNFRRDDPRKVRQGHPVAERAGVGIFSGSIQGLAVLPEGNGEFLLIPVFSCEHGVRASQVVFIV